MKDAELLRKEFMQEIREEILKGVSEKGMVRNEMFKDEPDKKRGPKRNIPEDPKDMIQAVLKMQNEILTGMKKARKEIPLKIGVASVFSPKIKQTMKDIDIIIANLEKLDFVDILKKHIKKFEKAS